MSESPAFTAFLMGLISAASLPLGTVTSAFWQPSDRPLAFMMAFGGGALLAALTIDLVASALARGHFPALALGCIIGGLIFIALNEILNDYGGFLRKASTTVYYLRRKDYLRFKRLLSQLGRLDMFQGLPVADFRVLARTMRCRHYAKGSTIFEAGDPAAELFIIEVGRVRLARPDAPEAAEQLGRYDALGFHAFLTGYPYAKEAVATEDTTLWLLPKQSFVNLLPNSRRLRQVMHRFLRSADTASYLEEQQGLNPEQIEAEIRKTLELLTYRGALPEQQPVRRDTERFINTVQRLGRPEVLAGLPQDELSMVAVRLLYKEYPRGYTLYHKGELASRLYFIDAGAVSLPDPLASRRQPRVLTQGETFGWLSTLTGGRHSTVALTVEPTRVWELRKSDLDALLNEAPQLYSRVKQFLNEGGISNYLQMRQEFRADAAARWIHQALSSLDAGHALPAVADLQPAHTSKHGAALAIWLGILLDGIPESLVIGASLVGEGVSLSLLAGLFLSNYPEALSSSVGMQQQGMPFGRTFLMWGSLMLITGLGAAVGNIVLAGSPESVFAMVEGLAAGAMLTMIAQTMLPEASFRGGAIVGFSTLLGFLVAIFFSTLN